jgi:hypothetical protein
MSQRIFSFPLISQTANQPSSHWRSHPATLLPTNMNTQSTMSAASSNYNAENFLTSLYHEPLDKLPQPIVGLHDQVRRQQERAVALLKRFQAPVRPRPEQLSLSAFFGDQSFGQQPQRPLVVDGQPSVVPQASRASVPLGVQPPIQQVMIPDVIDVTTEEPASKRRRTIMYDMRIETTRQ